MRRAKVENSAAPPRAGSAEAAAVTFVVPRGWLVAISVILVLPWLVAAGVYGYRSRVVAAPASEPAPADPSIPAPAGPWGRLVTTPIIVSPPVEYVPRNWGPDVATSWTIPATTPDEFVRFLSAAGFAADDIGRLQSGARRDARSGGFVVAPEGAFVRGLAPEIRRRLYLGMMKSRLDTDQPTPFRFYGDSLEQWLGPLVSPQTRERVAPYVYREGGFMYFADIDLVRREITDPTELQRLAKGLNRQATLLVEVQVDKTSDISAIAEYWGRGGRRTDIRPLLESLAESGGHRAIDISHLLPSLAREHLYRYPRLTVADYEKPLLANCLWTALNFFDVTPDDRLLDVQVALETLKRDYYIVHDGIQLGDVVAFSDREGNLFHAAVYLAGDLVFGKNGVTPMAPWSILPLERLKGHYVEDSDDWQVTYHRKKTL